MAHRGKSANRVWNAI